MEKPLQHFLITPDKFKGTLSASEVASIVGAAVKKFFPMALTTEIPIADGGDGSLDVLLNLGFKRIPVHSYNAIMEPYETSYGRGILDGKRTAFLEMANICGLRTMSEATLQPYFATSYGLGEVANQVLDTDVENIIISVGGSASTDGGIGFLTGLGAIIRDIEGSQVSANLNGLFNAASIDTSLLHPRLNEVNWTFLVDVSNPLVGPNGAARVFGPQKGLKISELEEIDQVLRKWAQVLLEESGIDVSNIAGSGAAGGVPAIGLSIFKAKFQSGAEWFYEALSLEDQILKADFVITGEGSFDSQSMMGKGPFKILEKAHEHGRGTALIAGVIEKGLETDIVDFSASLVDVAGDSTSSIREPKKWLEVATQNLLCEMQKTLNET